MDLTPETLRSATFRDKLRGYHPDDVDEFLESVARGLEVLLARLRDASERARAAAAAEPAADTDDAVRTLALAQRTADLAIHEAKAEAERLLKAADQRAKKAIGDAEETAINLAEQAQAELRTDLEKLQAARDQLFSEVNTMSAWLQGERSRIRRALVEIADKVETVRESKDAPPQRPVAPPAPPRQKIEEQRGRREAQAAMGVVPPAPTRPAPPKPAPPTPAPPTPPPSEAPKPPVTAAPAARTTPPRGQPVLTPPAAAQPDPSPAPEMPTSGDDSVLARAQTGIEAEVEEMDDDPYFAELRRAMTDDTPLGPRDDEWQAEDDSNSPQTGRSR